MKIALFCNAGMSTSMMAKRLFQAYESQDLINEIEAYDFSHLPDIAPECEVLIIGPQIAWAYDDIVRNYPDKIVMKLGVQEFGSMDGEALRKKIDALIS